MVASPNNLFSMLPLIGAGINRRTQAATVGTSGTTGSTMNNGPEWALGSTVLLMARNPNAAQGTRRFAIYVQAIVKGIKAGSQVTITYPTVEAASAVAGNWLNGSAAYATGDFGWVIENTAIV